MTVTPAQAWELGLQAHLKARDRNRSGVAVSEDTAATVAVEDRAHELASTAGQFRAALSA